MHPHDIIVQTVRSEIEKSAAAIMQRVVQAEFEKNQKNLAQRTLSAQSEHLSQYAAYLEEEIKKMPEGYYRSALTSRAEKARDLSGVMFRASLWNLTKD